jgi:SAM-dependent methyltransferase
MQAGDCSDCRGPAARETGMNDDCLTTISDTLTAGECLLLVLSRKRKAAREQFSKVSVRPLVLQNRPAYQFTFHFSDRVTHENLEPAGAARRAARLLERTFADAALYTLQADWSIRAAENGAFRCTSSPPTKSAAPPEAHNRTRQHLIPEGVPCPFLAEIGVMTPAGQVRNAMRHKFRQINRFLELVEDVVPEFAPERELRVVDFGCGKSYLTFALHHLLTQIHGRSVQIVGLDRKADVVAHCSEIAGRLGCRGLEFREGDIATHAEDRPVDLAVSLHACDTATDDALAQAVRWKSRAILAVPCCQHEFSDRVAGRELAPLIGHGILRERFAALATDAMRALALEICGYNTQVLEFIDLEHTAKNILIRAVERQQPDVVLQAARRADYESLKRLIGIDTPYLERALGSEVFAP